MTHLQKPVLTTDVVSTRGKAMLDIVDGHTYWQHPGNGPHNTPMVNEPLKSTVVELS